MGKCIAQFVACRGEPSEWTTRQQVFVPLVAFTTQAIADAYLAAAVEDVSERVFAHEVIRLDGGGQRRFLVRWNAEEVDEYTRAGLLETDDARYARAGVDVGDLIYLIGRKPNGDVTLLSRMTIAEAPAQPGDTTVLDIGPVSLDRIIEPDALFLNLLFWRAGSPDSVWDPMKREFLTHGRYNKQLLRRFRKVPKPILRGHERLPAPYRFIRPALVEDRNGKLKLGQTLRLLSEIARGGEWLDYVMDLGPKPTHHITLEAPSVSGGRSLGAWAPIP